MKVARTYVFVFLPIRAEWIPRLTSVRAFNGQRNRISPMDCKPSERLRWRGHHPLERDKQSLPNHLFWTWFVDNHPTLSERL